MLNGGNYGAVAYVSYARSDESRLGAVNQLHQDFSHNWVYLKVDENEIKPRESFDNFMHDIGRADCIVVLFSENYLRSFYCMLELTRIIQHGNVFERVCPVFIDDDFRIDGAKQKWQIYWRDKFESWYPASGNEPDEMDGIYGSQAECADIAQCIESIFNTFERLLASRIPTCNEEIIEWVKQTYFQRIQAESAFSSSIKYLKSCHVKTRSALDAAIDSSLDTSGGQRGELSESPEKIISYLVQLPIPSLLNVFDQAQSNTLGSSLGEATSCLCLKELSVLVQTLLPVLFQPEAVRNIRAGDYTYAADGIIAIPCASEVTAEILMAGIDRRVTDFRHRLLESDETNLRPGKFCLRLPPETGISGADENIRDMEDDLARRMGLDIELDTLCSDIDKQFFKKFVDDNSADAQERHLLVKDELEFIQETGEPGYYWIFEVEKAGSVQRWSELAQRLSARYPEILLLSLNKQHFREERKFFRMLHRIVPRHSVHGG